MKKFIVIAVLAALAFVASAAAHTGQLQVGCNGLTFSYQDFPANTEASYSVTGAGKTISGGFTIGGSGVVTIGVAITGPVSAKVSWSADGGGSASASGTLGCTTGNPPAGAGNPPPGGPPIFDYCGTTGPVVFAELLFKQPEFDPVWAGYTPAAYVEGIGTVCPWDVPKSGYVDSGTKVNPSGTNYGGDEESAIYEYWTKVNTA